MQMHFVAVHGARWGFQLWSDAVFGACKRPVSGCLQASASEAAREAELGSSEAAIAVARAQEQDDALLLLVLPTLQLAR